MRGLLTVAVLVLLASAGYTALGAVHVSGYVRKDGTYVAPHYRSDPDGNFYNNWSTKGNVNPFNGQEGSRVTPPLSASQGTRVYGSTSLPLLVQPNSVPSRAPGLPSYRDPASKSAEPSWELQRSAGWKEDNLFDFQRPNFETSARANSQNLKNSERAVFWKNEGYDFNPEFMSAYAMDRKAKDIQRAAYWKENGYKFNAEFMTAYAMDQKVKDI